MDKPKSLESIEREFLDYKNSLSAPDYKEDETVKKGENFSLKKKPKSRKKAVIKALIIILVILIFLALICSALYFISKGFTVPYFDKVIKYDLSDVPVIGHIISFIEELIGKK